MINSVNIKNFKSIVDLSMELGYFNVLIGENGCGKSNILEAIAFAGAASADKLDHEFLSSRGIRVTNPTHMFSAFQGITKSDVINFRFKINNEQHFFDLIKDNENNRNWVEKNKADWSKKIEELFQSYKERKEQIDQVLKTKGDDAEYSDVILSINEANKAFDEITAALDKSGRNDELSKYIIYSPEQSSLRKFEENTQIYPLGIRGEGLFQYLKEITNDKKSSKLLEEIKENLSLLDWFEDFTLPENLLSNEFSLTVKDRYLDRDLKYFDQRSTNEGFLYLLFFFTLFASKDTPIFFAIDNIDTSFNPKLCRQLIKTLAHLAKKHKKQVILTTHNTAILDGLDLSDDGQRLYVIRRNDEGFTKSKRIPYKENREMKLSEIWTNGFIGGLPENF